MASAYTLDGSEPCAPILPDGGEHAIVAMRYKNVELAFAMRPEHMNSGLGVTIEALRKCVMSEAGA